MVVVMPVRIPVGDSHALVDDADAHLVEGMRWHRCGNYARHKERVGPRSENKTRAIWMHRLILGLGAWTSDTEVDHVNGDGLDNRRVNLAIGSRARNMQNRRGGYGVSPHRGVSLRANGKWLAQAGHKGKKYHIGVFDTEQEAADAASAWRALHMGAHAA